MGLFLEAESNSIDIDKLDKILEAETYLTNNIYIMQQDNLEKRYFFFGIFEKNSKWFSGRDLVNSAYGAT